MQSNSQWADFKHARKAFVQSWQPDDPSRAAVCIVHGLGEHSGRYESLAKQLVARGLSAYALDQQGHGRSPLERGCIESYESMLQDISLFCGWVEAECPGKPIVLFGHSMGGNIVLNHALRMPGNYRGVISSSPMIRSHREPGWLKQQLVRLLLRVKPNHQMQSVITPERLMSDPVEQQRLREDALFHNRLSLRLGASLIDSGRWLLKHAPSLSKPLLLSHADNDWLTCHESSIEFASLAGDRCELRIWPGMLHDPFRSLQKEQVIDAFVSFIDRVCEES